MHHHLSSCSRALTVAALVTLLVACGDEADNPSSSSTTTAAPATTASSTQSSGVDKPEVKIPSEMPTKLEITDLVEGTGEAAKAGDTVIVNYVGVRSEDGTEFDNSYDRGEPYSVTIGQTSVIEGWTQGLVGVKQGGRRQLDIPADLAYGDSPPGDPIKPGDALSFVIDVVGLYGPSNPADEPDITVEAAPNQEKIGIDDLVDGTGATVQQGQTAVVQIIAYRGDTGEKLTSSWTDGTPVTFVVGEGKILAGIELGVEDMAIGGRRQVHVPYLMAFGDEGNADFGLPAKTDLVLVLDLIAAF